MPVSFLSPAQRDSYGQYLGDPWSTARPGRCKLRCHRSCRAGVSAHRYRSLGEPTSRVDAIRRCRQPAEVLGSPADVSRRSLSTTSLMGSSTRANANPAWAAATATTISPVPLGSTIATWAGFDEDIAVVALAPSRPVVPL